MKREIILLNIFFVFLLLLQGCNNTKQEIGREEKKKENKILTFSPDLRDKYYAEKSSCLYPATCLSSARSLRIQTYTGFLVFGKYLNQQYDSFINGDIFQYSECVLFGDSLYIKIDNGDVMRHKSIYLKIEKDTYKIIGTESTDISFFAFTPQESTLNISSNDFHVGDTIVGEISLLYKDSIWGYQADGHFMGVVNQGTEEWRKMLAGIQWGILRNKNNENSPTYEYFNRNTTTFDFFDKDISD